MLKLLGFVAAMLAAGSAGAATLRSTTTLHGPNVYVRDLFDGAGASGGLLLGPGPEPGGRIIVRGPQLNAIARQFGVNWRSGPGADQAVLQWPGRPLRQDEIMDAVRLALTAAGASADSNIELAGYAPPTVPVDARPTVTVSQLDYDPGTGRFTAALDLAGDGMNAIGTRISGVINEMTEVPVAATRLLADTVLRPADVKAGRVRLSLIQSDVARVLGDVVGMQVVHPVAAGQPLRFADLRRPPLVLKGATVQIELVTSALSISGQALAMDSGAQGERIRVQNLSSHAVLFAQVVGPGQVRVTPEMITSAQAANGSVVR
jgi:flagella basal body P-ring formation protein FlgA